MHNHLNTTHEDTSRVLAPTEHDALRRAAERADRHGLTARRTRYLPAGHWLVASVSDPTLSHEVILQLSDGQLIASCDCIGWLTNRVCQHVGVAVRTAKFGPWVPLQEHVSVTPAGDDVMLRIMEYDLREAHGMLAHALTMGDPAIIASCRREIARCEGCITRERALRSVVPA